MMPSAPRLAVMASLLVGAGCGISDPPEAQPVAVDLPFEARVGAKPFACGRTYTGLGTTATTYEPQDFRVYLHDVRLVTEGGVEVPVTLTEDGVWQKDGGVLLDFADKSGLCTNGTAATNTRLRGTAPAGTYKGLRFTLGVSEALNHQDVSTAPSPFNDVGLFWSWRFGYLFTRIEGRTTGLSSGHSMHLGSTDCAVLVPGQPSDGCLHPNRPGVELTGDVLGGGKVVLDLARLFEGSNLDTNTSGTAAGCMSGQQDPECAPLFQRLGLAFGAQAAVAQTFIRWEP